MVKYTNIKLKLAGLGGTLGITTDVKVTANRRELLRWLSSK